MNIDLDDYIDIFYAVPKKLRYNDDAVDRLSHRYTSVILVIFAVVSSMHQYIGQPIMCWVPAEFTDSHTKYTNSFCWVKNTYFLPFEEEIPKEHEDEGRREILYYQWVPFIFVLMAFFFYIPCQVWRTFNSKAGINANNILDAAEKYHKSEKDDAKEQTLRLIANQMIRFLGNRKESGICGKFRKMVATVCRCCGKGLGNYLVILYFFVKLLYIANVLGQLFILNEVLQTQFNMYGVEAIQNVVNKRDWLNETVFPKVTMCDFNIRRLGNVQRYTVQCVLPINQYTEKMFIFLWFWMVLVLFLTAVSLLIWLLRALCSTDRHSYIQNHLIVNDRFNKDSDQILCVKFVSVFLKQDGIFLLRLMGHNTSDVTVNEIIGGLWQIWLESHPTDDHESQIYKPRVERKRFTLKRRRRPPVLVLPPQGTAPVDEEAPPIYTAVPQTT